jgi:hypothetical protein
MIDDPKAYRWFHEQRCRKFYDETGNPFYAWEQYHLSRRQGNDLPDWVLAYLDECADRLCRLGRECALRMPMPWKRSRGRARDIGPQIAAALGMRRGRSAGRHSTPFGVESDQLLVAFIGMDVLRRIESGEKLLHAWEHAGDKFKVSTATARRAWLAFKTTEYYRFTSATAKQRIKYLQALPENKITPAPSIAFKKSQTKRNR